MFGEKFYKSGCKAFCFKGAAGLDFHQMWYLLCSVGLYQVVLLVLHQEEGNPMYKFYKRLQSLDNVTVNNSIIPLLKLCSVK